MAILHGFGLAGDAPAVLISELDMAASRPWNRGQAETRTRDQTCKDNCKDNLNMQFQLTRFLSRSLTIVTLILGIQRCLVGQEVEFLFSFGGEGTGIGSFDQPDGIALDIEGNLYISEFSNHRVQIFDRDGLFQSTFGVQGTGRGEFTKPDRDCGRRTWGDLCSRSR